MPTSLKVALWLILLEAPTLLHAQAWSAPSTEVATSFLSQRSLKAGTSQGFWLTGGSAEAAVTFLHGIGIAASYTGSHTGSIGSSGVPLNLSVLTFGPRYRWRRNSKISVYGEGLFGVGRGFDSVFPGASGSVTSASSFALQLNSGVDYRLSSRFAVRLLDVGYLRMTLPNGTNNEQNILGLSAGIVFHFR